MDNARVFGLIWNTVKRLFNKDHEVTVRIVYESGAVASLNMTSNAIPGNSVKVVKYQVEIVSPAGKLIGEGQDIIDAYTDAIKTVQK